MIRQLAAIIALFAIVAAAWADPPPGADPNSEIGHWFKSLHSKTGGWCCDISDGRPVEYRVTGDHYEVLIGTQFPNGPDPAVWVEVPSHAVLERTDNPVGRAVAFWRRELGILCFVRPAEG
jgi:hypothetical protein